MAKYATISTSEDYSTTIGQASTALGTGATLTLPGSFAITDEARVGDITYNAFSEQAQSAMETLVDSVNYSTSQLGKSNKQVVSAVTEAVRASQMGELGVIGQIAKYGALAFGLVIAGKVLLGVVRKRG